MGCSGSCVSAVSFGLQRWVAKWDGVREVLRLCCIGG